MNRQGYIPGLYRAWLYFLRKKVCLSKDAEPLCERFPSDPTESAQYLLLARRKVHVT